ncbi:hypothetical protein IIA15_04090 [candidate division TA06 bacterium]|nr:hypothetical protein [candidate division TA06 bacterium]
MASSGGDTVRIWDVATGRKILEIAGRRTVRVLGSPQWDVSRLAFSPDGEILATIAAGAPVRLWNSKTGKELANLKYIALRAWDVAFSPDGTTLAMSGSGRGLVFLMDVATRKPLRKLEVNPSNPDSAGWADLAFSPDGRTIAAGSWGGFITIWDWQTGEWLRQIQASSRRVGSLAFSPDGKSLLSGSEDKTVKLWDVADASR